MTGPVHADAPPLLVAGGPDSLREAWAGLLGGSATDVAALQARLAGDPGSRCLAFYRSPWETFISDCDVPPGIDAGVVGRERLARWIDEASALVAVATQWPARVRLVNAGRLADRQHALAGSLAADGWCPALPAPAFDAGDAALEPTLLARLFEDYAPEGWDAYESLESMALLLGREAEFRMGDIGPADPLAAAMRVWSGSAAAAGIGATSRALEVELGRAQEQILRLEGEHADAEGLRGRAEAERHGLEAELADRSALVQELSSENELLLEHVAQLQQELADHARQGEQLRATVQRLSHAADQARRLISK